MSPTETVNAAFQAAQLGHPDLPPGSAMIRFPQVCDFVSYRMSVQLYAVLSLTN